MKTFVLSHQHHLAPLAWRLTREGEEVDLIITRKRYQRAMDGRLEKPIRGEDLVNREYPNLDHPDLKPWVEAALLGETRVVTNLHGVPNSTLGGSTHLLFTLKTPPPTRENYSLVLGGWFDGAGWTMPHWYLPDWGLFPGGGGAEVIAGGAILRGRDYPMELLEPLTEALAGFRGMVGMGVRFVPATGRLESTGYFRAGWEDWLHWELALCQVESWVQLMDTGMVDDELPPYTVGVVVSQPPWPAVGHPVPPKTPIRLTPAVTKDTYFHDVCIEDGAVWTAGCDGLVGVTRGTGRSLAHARAKALSLAGAIDFPERQARGDVAGMVDGVLVGLEELGYW